MEAGRAGGGGGGGGRREGAGTRGEGRPFVVTGRFV